MIIGYARVSTDDQSLDAQTDALTTAGAGNLFADKISGSKRERPELDKMLEDRLNLAAAQEFFVLSGAYGRAGCWNSADQSAKPP